MVAKNRRLDQASTIAVTAARERQQHVTGMRVTHGDRARLCAPAARSRDRLTNQLAQLGIRDLH
jgi:hypothetical protein